jgi:hypothetical protein
MSKTYLATETTVAEIRDYVRPTNLSSVQVLIVDFTDPNLNIIAGGLDTNTRTIIA